MHYEQADLDEEMMRRAQEEEQLLQEQNDIGGELSPEQLKGGAKLF